MAPFLTLLAVFPALCMPPTNDGYLPSTAASKWVLRNAASASPAVFEVVALHENDFTIRSVTPWGSSEWTLSEKAGKFVMTAYGTGGRVMPLAQQPLYLDFTRPAGTEWVNPLGTFTVMSRNVVTKSISATYPDCIQIRHKYKGGSSLFTFADGVGFVQFSNGNAIFVLDEASSALPGRTRPAAPEAAAPRQLETPMISPEHAGIVFGLTPNRFAGEPMTVDVMMKRFQQTLDAGVGFLVGNGTWQEMEGREGQYSLGALNQVVSLAEKSNLKVSFTLRIINTIVKNVPASLQGASWMDPRMRTRTLRLIEAIAPHFRGRVRWFMFGYEVDGYFEKHPGEVKDFVELQRLATARMRELVPGIECGTTLTFSGIGALEGRLAPLNSQMDSLALTYTPTRPGFTVQDPSVLLRDFARMKKIAAGRKIVLQEIGYPTAESAGGSEDKQAEFYRLAFQEFARDPEAFEAVNFMNLADLSDETAGQFTAFYGMRGSAAFKGLLQTMGMFDARGMPKKSWDVFRKGLGH